MVLALRELLERIRPAGAPGAPTEGERLRDASEHREEMAAVAAVVAGFAAEAEAIVDAARSEAREIRAAGERRVERIGQQLPEEIARAEAITTSRQSDRDGRERDVVLDQTRSAIERIDAAAAERTAPLVVKAMETIWAVALPEASDEGERGG